MNQRTLSHREAPIGNALTAIARNILMEARAPMDDPSGETGEAIHDFRKAIKRWRAFLRLVEPEFGDGARNLRRAARDSAKDLNAMRDLRACLDALEDAGKDRDAPGERALTEMRGVIEALLARQGGDPTDALDRQGLVRRVSEWLNAISYWDFSRIAFAQVLDALTRGYRRARHAMPKDWRHVDDEALHEFRRRIIDHRYQLEFAGALWPDAAKIEFEKTQYLREILGNHRDLALLARLTGPHQPLARFRAKIAPTIARRQKEHLAHAARIAARAFDSKPRKFRADMEKRWLRRAKN